MNSPGGKRAFGNILHCSYSGHADLSCRKAKPLEIPGRDAHAPSSYFEWMKEARSVQRKVLYLPPSRHFACESIFLLGHSEAVGFRYLIQFCRLSEMNVCVKKRMYVCSQAGIPQQLYYPYFGFFPDGNVTLGRTPELGQRPGRTSIRI